MTSQQACAAADISWSTYRKERVSRADFRRMSDEALMAAELRKIEAVEQVEMGILARMGPTLEQADSLDDPVKKSLVQERVQRTGDAIRAASSAKTARLEPAKQQEVEDGGDETIAMLLEAVRAARAAEQEEEPADGDIRDSSA